MYAMRFASKPRKPFRRDWHCLKCEKLLDVVAGCNVPAGDYRFEYLVCWHCSLKAELKQAPTEALKWKQYSIFDRSEAEEYADEVD